MFNLVVLSALVAVAVARPEYVQELDAPVLYRSIPVPQREYVTIQEPTVTKVGAVVESVPSAVSHQSSSVVHSRAQVVTPILAKTVKTYHVPVVRTYAAAPVGAISSVAHSIPAARVAHAVPIADNSPLSYGYDVNEQYDYLH